MGEWDAATATEPFGALEYNVARIFIHPQYTASNLRNNVAILRLATQVNLGQVRDAFFLFENLKIYLTFQLASNNHHSLFTQQFGDGNSLLGCRMGKK